MPRGNWMITQFILSLSQHNQKEQTKQSMSARQRTVWIAARHTRQLSQKLLSGWEQASGISVLGFRCKCCKHPYIPVSCNCHWKSAEALSYSDYTAIYILKPFCASERIPVPSGSWPHGCVCEYACMLSHAYMLWKVLLSFSAF